MEIIPKFNGAPWLIYQVAEIIRVIMANLEFIYCHASWNGQESFMSEYLLHSLFSGHHFIPTLPYGHLNLITKLNKHWLSSSVPIWSLSSPSSICNYDSSGQLFLAVPQIIFYNLSNAISPAGDNLHILETPPASSSGSSTTSSSPVHVPNLNNWDLIRSSVPWSPWLPNRIAQ